MTAAGSWLAARLRPRSFRGKRRLLDGLVPKTGTRSARVYGASFELDLSELIQREIFLGTFEPAEGRMVARILRPGDTFIDVGANVGFFTALAARAVGPTGRVIAYEPSPVACAKLRQMVEANRLHQVEVVEAGLGATAGSETIYWSAAAGNHTPTMLPHPASDHRAVEVRTLDAEARRLDLASIALIKIDVEGFELRVFQGATGLLARHFIRRVLCEFNQPWLSLAGTSIAALAAHIEAAGFHRAAHSGMRPDSPNRLYELTPPLKN